MKLSYALTLEDYKAAHVLHARQTVGRRVNEFIFYLGMQILAAALVLVTFGAAAMGNKHLVSTLVPIDAGVLWLAVCLPVARAVNLRRCFNQLFPPHRTDRTSHLEITEDCIVSGVPGVSEGKIYWPGVFAFAMDARIAMIYLAPRRFIFFPTSILTLEDRSEVIELAKKLVKGKVSC
jgi:hypothetical protein